MNRLYLVLIALSLMLNTAVAQKIDRRRGEAPQSVELLAQTQSAGAAANGQVLLRIFKESHQLELWKRDAAGRYNLVRTFEICRFSGNLGPKKRTGDLQAPEGFYTVKPSQMNPYSIAYLSVNTGFPNEYDRANRHTGSALMIHGGCRSVGCYAIEDAPMQDLYAAMRDAFRGGQREIQLHIFPFRMNAWNMMLHKSDPNMDFWQQLKPGYDDFEERRQEITYAVRDKRYMVQAQAPAPKKEEQQPSLFDGMFSQRKYLLP